MGRRLHEVWVHDFRSYDDAHIEFGSGLTALVGPNGHGKTNMLEAIGFLGSGASFRGATNDTMVKVGAERAVVRGRADRAGRELLIETEISRRGRGRIQVNRQRVQRAAELAEALSVTVFAPDDLEIVKGGPSERRTWLDGVVVNLDPRRARIKAELDRVLRQRNALLKQAGGRLTDEISTTLEVWDQKLVENGERWASARSEVLEAVGEPIQEAYRQLSGGAGVVGLAYEPEWRAAGLAVSLEAARRDELRRGVSLVGPHRDDIVMTLDGMPSRTHSSQGEQRSIALALRLGGHIAATGATGVAPLLLLDDVFSELDDDRGRALLGLLPAGQTVLTTATEPPPGSDPDLILDIDNSVITPR